MTVLELPELENTTIYSTTIYNCPFKIINFPKLKKFYSNDWYIGLLAGCAECTHIYCPKLESLHQYSSIHYSIFNGCSKLQYIKLGKIISEENVALGVFPSTFIHLEFGDDTAFVPNLINNSYGYTADWQLSYDNNCSTSKRDLCENDFCKNNIEQLLYNFRVYIIDRLHNRSTTTKRNLKLPTKLYNVLFGVDETGYALNYTMPNDDNLYIESMQIKLNSINWGIAYADS